MALNERPPLDRATVDFALKLAPNKCPSITDTERSIWMAAGARLLAEKLDEHCKHQERNYLQT